MSIITEIKRIGKPGEFAALLMLNSFGSLEHISGLYLEVTKERFGRLRETAEDLPVAGASAVLDAGEFFSRITLLDSSVHDSEQLMLLVDESKIKAIPPIQENVLAVLNEGTHVDWKIEVRRPEREKITLTFFGDGTDGNNVSFHLDTENFPLDRFSPDLMIKEFFKI